MATEDFAACIYTSAIFGFAIFLSFLSVVLERIWTNFSSNVPISPPRNEIDEKQEKETVDDHFPQEVWIDVSESEDEALINSIPKYGICRRISQKLQQLFLEFNSFFAICMILLTCAKLFVQIFDIVTDIMVAGTVREEAYGVYYTILIVFINAPIVMKWKSTGEFITQKCKQGRLHISLSWIHGFFPIGVFTPFVLDIYIVAKMIEGNVQSLFTGIPYKLDDSLFSIQRTFALSEVQLESLPQAIVQTIILLIHWNERKTDAPLIFMSITISLASIVFQYLSMKRLSEKESFQSVFDLLETLSRGEFIPGVNHIRNSGGSILNLFDVFLDKDKVDFVRDLLRQRPKLNTIILNPNVLTFDFDFLKDWLYEMNSISLKFLKAEGVEDIGDAFDAIDENGDGRISIQEFRSCGEYAIRSWADKYGENFKMGRPGMLNFLRTENVELKGTCFSIYELIAKEDVDSEIRERAKLFVQSFCKEHLKINHTPPQALRDDLETSLSLNNTSGLMDSLNGGLLTSLKTTRINLTTVRFLYFPNLTKIDLQDSGAKDVAKIFHGNLPSLTYLNLSNCKALADDGITNFSGVPHLETLDLSYSNWKNCQILFESDHLKLKELNLMRCKSLLSEDVGRFGLPTLETLNLSESNWKNETISDDIESLESRLLK